MMAFLWRFYVPIGHIPQIAQIPGRVCRFWGCHVQMCNLGHVFQQRFPVIWLWIISHSHSFLCGIITQQDRNFNSSYNVDLISHHTLTHWPLTDLNKIIKRVLFKINSVIDGCGISCEIALRWLSLDVTDDKATLLQVGVMAAMLVGQ